MIAYNLSIKVNYAICDKWIEWQQKEHIPEIMATGIFTHFNFLKLLGHDDKEGVTFIIQYYTGTIVNYHRYEQQFAAILREKARAKWSDGFIIFSSLMETVQ